MAQSPLAPDPNFHESADRFYERKTASNPARRGPLRFQEGIASDSDVPSEFSEGVMQGYRTPPGRSNHNVNVFTKSAEETTRERAHVGSASWPEAPTFISAMAEGASERELSYSSVDRGERPHIRRNYARVD
ncbi:hypothetical protein [Streptomyces sp. MMBL 11-1]|uniref:hypothetical protein n=1 Tax=Streptomyces sp. MMBL 11-1 TaxID=3026420 RepID=UPI002360F7AB|nr:hypothetical protein [Streptomyces sp. MMBL 11-1]